MTNESDLVIDAANIVLSLACNYKGDAKSEILALAERLKTDEGFPEYTRGIAITNLNEAYQSLIGKCIIDDNGYAFRFAANTAFDILLAAYKHKQEFPVGFSGFIINEA